MRSRLLLAYMACALGCTAAPPPMPEAASGRTAKPGWTFEREAVVAAHPLAVQAGAQVLAQGGNAVDAAVATQLVLAVVEPQSSGVGGGGFLVLWDGQQVRTYDGRETAPQAASESLFLRPDGSPLPRESAIASGLGVGTPGLLRLLETAHQRHGRLPWAQLVQPAEQIAHEGFSLSPRLHHLLKVDAHLRHNPAAAAFYFQADGTPWPVGHRLRNPALAALLRAVAQSGADAFYRGPVAADLVQRVRSHTRPGHLSSADLAHYTVQAREPLCGLWLRWRYCGMGPPAAGTLLVGQLLALAGAVDLDSAAGLHRYAEAARLASADRDLHVADPAYVPAPAGDWLALLAPDYLQARAALMGSRAGGPAVGGQPKAWVSPWAPQADPREAGTTHLSVVDAQGMAVSLTSSVESAFGSRILADGGSGLPGGYFLNNQLTDFAFVPRSAQGQPVANRVEPGKRPRSSMAPMLLFEGERLVMVLGSPGGLGIPHFNAKVLLRHLGHGQALQAAVDAPNAVPTPERLVLERHGFSADVQRALGQLGHKTLETDVPSGLHALSRGGAGWRAAADPRREGAALGR